MSLKSVLTALGDSIRNLSGGTGLLSFEQMTAILKNITKRSASDLSASGASVSVPAGYYSESASKSVATVAQATPSISVDIEGMITASAAQSAGYVASGTKSATKQLTAQAAQTITPGTSDKIIASETYLTGTQTIKGDANLIGANIVKGKSIFGVAGTAASIADGGYTGDLYSFTTATVSPASGVSQVSFSNVPKEPDFFVIYLNSADISQYHRAGVVVYDGETVYGQEYYSGTDDCYFHENANDASDYYWRYTYSGTTLTIASSSNSKGGYFHNPGTYTLLYAYKDNDNGTVAISKQKVTSSGGTSLSFTGLEGEPVWYSAVMRGNQDAQASSANTVVFANEQGYSHMTNASSANYVFTAATAHDSYSGGTLTISPGSDVFSANEYALIYAYLPPVSTVVDTSDATAAASDMAEGVTAYVNGRKITGTVTEHSPESEDLYKSWSYTEWKSEYDPEEDNYCLHRIITFNKDVLVRQGTPMNNYVWGSELGDAKPEDVATGKTFTSAAGLKVTGTAVFEGTGSSGASVGTATATPSANSTSITFTGLTDQPKMFSITPKENISFSTSNRFVVNVAYDGTTAHGMYVVGSGSIMMSSYTGTYSAAYFTWTYSNGTLTVSTDSETNGGYFANGVDYQLTYAV